MDVVGVMAAYSDPLCVCVLHSLERHCSKHCIKLPDDGSLVIRNMLEQILNIFKYFIIILIVSTNYIFVHLLDNKVF